MWLGRIRTYYGYLGFYVDILHAIHFHEELYEKPFLPNRKIKKEP